MDEVRSMTGFSKKGWSYSRAFDRLLDAPKGYLWLFAVCVANSDIENGGFAQYFDNSTSIGAGHAYRALKAAGASNRATALLRAVKSIREKGGESLKCEVDDALAADLSGAESGELDDIARDYSSGDRNWEALLILHLTEYSQELFGRRQL